MSKWKNRFMKRAMAFILSGAMILSDAALSGVTAYAAETDYDAVEADTEVISEGDDSAPQEVTVKENENTDDPDADGEITADLPEDAAAEDDAEDKDAADDDGEDAKGADNEDAEKVDEADSKAAADDIVPESEDSDEKATIVESAVDEVTAEDNSQEIEAQEVVEEETSDVEATEEFVDNQAQAGSATLTNGLKKGKDYGDDILKLSVFEDMDYTVYADTVAGVKYAGFVVGKNNPTRQNNIPTDGAAFKIETLKAAKITFAIRKADPKSSAKTYYFVKEEADGETGTVVQQDTVPTDTHPAYTFDMDAGCTYYFYVAGSKVSVHGINWESKAIDESTRKSWTEVEDPVISDVSIDETDPSKINVTVNGVVGLNGADEMTVFMYNAEDSENKVVDSIVSATEQDTTKFSFTPPASGTYKFQAEMMREVQPTKKTSDLSEPISFTCPLVPPTGLSAESLGGGKIQIKWSAVPEVDKYVVEVVDHPEITPVESEKTSATVSGLTIGTTYSFTVYAVKGTENSDKSEPIKCKAENTKITWEIHRYGNGVDTTNNKLTEEKELNSKARLISQGGKGKIVPASTDGLMFYCTKVPTNKNFTFSANAHVNTWTFSNGQEGFGVMAADTVGKDGTGGEFWNNSYQAVVSRISYKWNGVGISTDDSGEKIEMQIGVGSTEKVGVTSSDVSNISKGALEVPKRFRAGQTAIDSTFAKYGAGQYNIVGNHAKNEDKPIGSDHEQFVDFYLQVQRNNTGYFVSYTKYKMDDKGAYILDADGNKILDTSTTTVAKYYEPNALNVLDKNYIYVGVFTARNADVTFTNMTLETIDPADDAPADEKEVKYYNLATSILSSTVTNSTDYQFIFHSNWNGKLVLKDSAGNYLSRHTLTDEEGKPILDKDGKEQIIDYYEVTGSLDPEKSYLQDGTDEKNTKVYIDLNEETISIGKNVFTVEYEPDKDWCPDQIGDKKYAKLNSYDKVKLTFTVEYRKYGEQGQTIYVSQYGTSANIGTKESPLDIYTAVKYAQPGQTILLAGGTYRLNRTLQTPRGVDGKPDIVDGKETYKNYIKMMAEDPEYRPVLDFMSLVPAVVTVGNYWYFKNIDVTRCKDGEKGIQVSSSHCVFDRVDTYKNGSTGLQISRLASQDTYKDWPSDNLILNCNSYLNVDKGFEDADGFAAKLTSGSNNVFDGCIAAFNADDGWDLFAKVQSGSIGAVTIRNSIAYRNGYVLLTDPKDNTTLDEHGTLVKGKGNGNGFKMGGDGLQGGSVYDEDYDETASVRKSGHKIYNSLAFYNKMKGFDSNSCPNVKAYNCVAFNNEGANFGFTSAAKNPNTDFVLQNVISFRTEATTDKNNDSVAGSGTQKKSNWFNKTTYLMQDKKSSASKNTDGDRVKESDFVSLEYKSLNCVDLNYWRNPEDGTVDTHGFLSIRDDSTLLTKPSMGGIASNDIEPGDDTVGNITGAVGTEGAADDYGEDFPEGGLDVKDKVEDTEDQYEPRYFGKIWVADIKYLDYTDREPIEYTGKQIMPELHVRFSADAALLRKGKDYTVKYENNIQAGTATAKVTGVGNYKGFETTKTFKILAIDVNDYTVAIPSSVVVSDVSKVSKEIKPTWQGKALKYGADYTIEQKYPDNPEKANIYVVKGVREEPVEGDGQTQIQPVGNFTGEKPVTVLTVADVPADKLLNKASVTIKDKNLSYTGSYVVPKEVEVKLNGTVITEGFKIECSNNLEIGKATLTVVGDGEKYFGSKSVNFNIKGGNLKDVVDITFRREKNADGSEKKIYLEKYMEEGVTFTGADCSIPENTIIVTLKSDDPNAKKVTLKNGIDYKIVQSGTKKAGNATVSIKGMNGFTGTLLVGKFTINPLAIDDDSAVAGLNVKYEFDPTIPYMVGGAKYESNTNFFVKINGQNVDSKYYTLSYKNNTMVGTADSQKAPTVIVTGRNGLKGKKEFTFNIESAGMTGNTDFSVSAKDITTNGKTINDEYILYYSDLKKSTITVTQSYEAKGKTKTKKLSAGRDYDKNAIQYFIDVNDNFVIDEEDIKEGNITTEVMSNSKTPIEAFKKKGYVTILVRVGSEESEESNNNYNYKGQVDGYFRAAMYDINRAKVINLKSRVYGMNWKPGNGLSVAIDWSDIEVAKLEEFIEIRYKTNGNTNEGEDLTELDRKYGKPLTCLDRIGAYTTNTTYAADYLVKKGDGFVIDPNSYKKNDRVGTASFTIIGTGKFAGTKKVTYKIVNKETAKKMIEKGKDNEVEAIRVNAIKVDAAK